MVCERWSRFSVPPFSCCIQVLFFEFLKDIERLLSAFNTELLIVERYNQFAESGEDEDFHKSAVNLIAISEPPFYAFNEGLAALVTVSSLRLIPSLKFSMPMRSLSKVCMRSVTVQAACSVTHIPTI